MPKRFSCRGRPDAAARDTLFAAIVGLPEPYEHCRAPGSRFRTGSDFRPSHRPHTIYRHQLKPHQLLAERFRGMSWTMCTAPVTRKRGWNSRIKQTAVGHGVAVWFETCLMEGIGYSTEPQTSET